MFLYVLKNIYIYSFELIQNHANIFQDSEKDFTKISFFHSVDDTFVTLTAQGN